MTKLVTFGQKQGGVRIVTFYFFFPTQIFFVIASGGNFELVGLFLFDSFGVVEIGMKRIQLCFL